MFDPIGAFKKQFVPSGDGYIYYPSKKSGGKLITATEFEKLVADWTIIAGRKGQWKAVGVIVLVIMLWTAVSQYFDFSRLTDQILTYGIVTALSAKLLWANFAPRRLVRNRDIVVPPRRSSEARQQARSLLNWPFVIFGTLISGGIFFSHLSNRENTLPWWAWIVGSGIFFALYLWISLQKFRDINH
ncbi:hypothetical protein D3Y57_02510 (plasmid) [Sphingomonas paeninsulae]|uniref:Uncharacterized protein n=1 Tax=Sphingomonas paeninsulae TaxID=2319844 RepID=A0A494T7S6_SPHPE|nr:hypothetical protein [Sphingomonas paeninsulae]AYJ84950.1 hypothetical protein D3Y57_02510 [Sphingomonas paeninsulae]